MEIPFITDKHPTTQMTNARLGTWLFLASELMLFGALFSSYIVLKRGSLSWPNSLGIGGAAVNTAILLLSSITVVFSCKSAAGNRWREARILLGLTLLLGALFLSIKGYEWRHLLAQGHSPAAHNFFGMYFVLTGTHALHLIGGILFFLPLSIRKPSAIQLNRLKCGALYWNFVDAVWIGLFGLLYVW